MNEIFNEEVLYLDNTIKKYSDIRGYTKQRLELFPKMYKDNPFQLADLMYRAELKIKLLDRTKDKPYFARIDFKSSDGNLEKCYIGKIGVTDEDNKIVTVDWRAPVAALYYDASVGDASYESPSGLIEGNLSIKRQFNIEDGKLISFQDVDTVSNDEMLKPYLNANADNRLKNIVSTIQHEQNNIIRESINNNIIVQGVAGSGKTTVALHRIAYLVYNNIDKYKPEDYLVIGPNKFFVNYISSVLPDLDVNGVNQLTYDEIVSKLLGVDLELTNENDKIKEYLEDKKSLNFCKLRVSMEYKKLIDKFLKRYIDNIFSFQNDLIYKGYKILDKLDLKKIYLDSEMDQVILSKGLDKYYARFSKYVTTNQIRLLLRVRNIYESKISSDAKELLLVEKEIKNRCNNLIKKYFIGSKANVLKLYISFLESLDDNDAIDHIKNIRKKKVDVSDLGALLYLYYRLYGNDNFSNIRHTVVDEAQDFGEFMYYALAKILPKSTFSIFGDKAQAIYEYRSIGSWNKIIDTSLFNANILYLKKSYRTTVEIMNEANKISGKMNIEIAEPVIRHGEDVKYIKSSDILCYLKDYIAKKYKSIAIICKDERECNEVYNYLISSNIDVTNVSSDNIEYKGGICTITSYLAKGLEFDGVIIKDASSDIYNTNKIVDMKLLYVAMTRALHELTVLYSRNLVLYLEASNE